jgi:predicted transcriptional regulator
VLAHRLSEAQETIRLLMETNRDLGMKLNDVQTRVLGEMDDANEQISVLRKKLTDFGIMS